MRRMKNCCTPHQQCTHFWKLIESILAGSKHITKVLIILTVFKSSIATERFRFCFATRPYLREYKDALKANVSTLWSLVTQKLWWEQRKMSMGSGEGIVSAFPTEQDGRKGVWWGWTPIIGVRTLDVLRFSIHWNLSYGFISSSASCILNIEWNANVTFKLSKGCWKWTVMCREYLVWIGTIVKREKVIISKGILTEEKKRKKKKKKIQTKFLT